MGCCDVKCAMGFRYSTVNLVMRRKKVRRKCANG